VPEPSAHWPWPLKRQASVNPVNKGADLSSTSSRAEVSAAPEPATMCRPGAHSGASRAASGFNWRAERVSELGTTDDLPLAELEDRFRALAEHAPYLLSEHLADDFGLRDAAVHFDTWVFSSD
jgi:hypothetical protein